MNPVQDAPPAAIRENREPSNQFQEIRFHIDEGLITGVPKGVQNCNGLQLKETLQENYKWDDVYIWKLSDLGAFECFHLRAEWTWPRFGALTIFPVG